MDTFNNRMILVKIALLFLLICNLNFLASLRPETKNRFHMDRLQCKILKPKIIRSLRCVSKHISMSNLKIDFELNATRPIRNVWVRAILYHKFNGVLYNKFPFDFSENFCEFFDGKREKTIFLNWWLARLEPFSNLNHSCPYSNMLIKADNISMDQMFSFDKEILPSGRYRVDVSFMEDNRVPLFEIQFFGTNSDH